MDKIYERITYVFDPMHAFYEHEKLHKKLSAGLVFLFLFSLLVIELNRQQFLPEALAAALPANHFHAVQMAFSIILVLEVISLIFVLPCSFSKSLGKQFEILSLILIRNAFKELSYFPEPITYLGNEQKILHILSDGFGALLIFGLLGVYYALQKRTEDNVSGVDIYGFVAAKKGISLLLLVSFCCMGTLALLGRVSGTGDGDFFHDFYTLLILTDILIVLISQCFHPSAKYVFRNSGYALSTLMIRIALVAPVYFNVLLGVAAIGFAIFLSLINNYLFQGEQQNGPSRPEV